MRLKRDWLLKQLDITQWILRRQSIFHGGMVASPLPKIELLIVTRVTPDSHDPLFCDVLHSLGLTPPQTCSLTPEQVLMLPPGTECNSWRLGQKEPITLLGAHLFSPPLLTLSQNPRAKRIFWQQIYHHEQYFNTNRGRFQCGL